MNFILELLQIIAWPAASVTAMFMFYYALKGERLKTQQRFELLERMATIEETVSARFQEALLIEVAERTKLQAEFEEVKKLSDETKRFVSQANLAMGFRAPTRKRE